MADSANVLFVYCKAGFDLLGNTCALFLNLALISPSNNVADYAVTFHVTQTFVTSSQSLLLTEKSLVDDLQIALYLSFGLLQGLLSTSSKYKICLGTQVSCPN